MKVANSLAEALYVCRLRCNATEEDIPARGFKRLHNAGDRAGSKNIALARVGHLGYIKHWKTGAEAYFHLNGLYPYYPPTEAAPSDSVTKAAEIAAKIMHEAPIATKSDYFRTKGLDISGLRLRVVSVRELLDVYGYQSLSTCDPNSLFTVIPIYAIKGKKPVLQSAQLIGGGVPPKKHFLKGGTKKGGFWLVKPIPKSDASPVIGVAEGVATAISAWLLFRDTGHLTTVAAAFDCGNLTPVCQSLRKRWPNVDLIIFADNDRPDSDKTPNQSFSAANIGVAKAMEAARAVSARVHAPSFSADQCKRFEQWKGQLPTDWNDYWQLLCFKNERTRGMS